MNQNQPGESPTIVFGVTSAQSLRLLGPLPEAMADSGWKVHLVCSPDHRFPHAFREPVTLHEIPMSRNPSPYKDALALFRWISLLKNLRPDVVSVGTPKAALLGMLASCLCGVPARIYVLRGLRLETARGWLRLLLWVVEKITSGSSTRILATSPSVSKLYSDLKLARPSKMELLGLGSSHGVDTSHFVPLVGQRGLQKKKFGLNPELPVIGFVGRLSEDKGSTTLMEIHESLARRGLDHQMLIVGSPEIPMEVSISPRIKQSQLIFLGHVPDPAGVYRAMDFLLLPTLREGFPNVALEAGASGIPVIVSDATGAIDSVVPGKTGLVVPKGDSVAFLTASVRLLQQPHLREELGVQAREWVTSNFDYQTVTVKHVRFYREQLA